MNSKNVSKPQVICGAPLDTPSDSIGLTTRLAALADWLRDERMPNAADTVRDAFIALSAKGPNGPATYGCAATAAKLRSYAAEAQAISAQFYAMGLHPFSLQFEERSHVYSQATDIIEHALKGGA